ncbi:hypothetical protein SDJN03_23791, partial [Cucurbita argyrosperma subsp. sororia]
MEVEGLERNFEAFNGAANDEEARLRELERKPHKIALVYLIWLRCFLFAVSRSSSSHKCVPWWMVVGLILSATAVHLLVFLEAVTMMFRTLNALNIILREQTGIWHQLLVAVTAFEVCAWKYGFKNGRLRRREDWKGLKDRAHQSLIRHIWVRLGLARARTHARLGGLMGGGLWMVLGMGWKATWWACYAGPCHVWSCWLRVAMLGLGLGECY